MTEQYRASLWPTQAKSQGDGQPLA